MRKFTEAGRLAAAVILYLAALCASPLAWLRIGGARVPFFGDAQLFSLSELGVLALGAVVLFADRQLLKRRFLLLGSALTLLVSFIQLMIYRDAFEEFKIALFYAAMPIAGAVLAPELRRVFPVIASFTAIIALVCGVTSPDFTGFTGNWNWSQCLIAAFVPFLWYLAGVKKWFIGGIVTLLLLSALTITFRRAEFSRAVLIAIAGSTFLLLFRSKVSPSTRFKILIGLTAAAALALVCTAFFVVRCDESRPALWAGALELAFDHPFVGVGAGRFPGIIDPYLPLRYALTAFPALLHPHAHCELLHLWCSFGIAGAVWFIALEKIWCDGAETEGNRPFLWASALFAICGCFDMTLATPLCGTVFLLTLGILAAPETRSEPTKLPAWQLIAGAFLLFVCAGDAAARWKSSSELRKGKLCFLKGNQPEALTHFEQSLRHHLLPEAAYNAALLRLQMPDGAKAAWRHLRRLEKESSCSAYGYADRLRGAVLIARNNNEAAKLYLQKERIAHPYSVIGARLYWQLLKFRLKTPQEEIDRAYADLVENCRLRQIPLSKAATITEAQDRAPFAPEIRRQK